MRRIAIAVLGETEHTQKKTVRDPILSEVLQFSASACVHSPVVRDRRCSVWSALQWKYQQQKEDIRYLGSGTLRCSTVTRLHTKNTIVMIYTKQRTWLTARCVLCFRGSRKHKGLDIVCADGATVYAPFDVTIERRVIVYTDPAKAAINNGLQLRGGGS